MKHVQIGTKDVGGDHAVIFKPLDTGKEALEFLKEVQDSQSVPVRLYRMVVFTQNVRYQVSTTSKDVFLKLGSLGANGQDAFVRLVHQRASSMGDLLITFPHEGGCKGLMCTIRLFGGEHAEIMVSQAFDK